MKHRCFAILSACLLFCSGAGLAVGAPSAAAPPAAVQGISTDNLEKMSLPPVLEKWGRRLMTAYEDCVQEWEIQDPEVRARVLKDAEESVLAFMKRADGLYKARMAYAESCLAYTLIRHKAADVPLDAEDFDDEAFADRMRSRFVEILDASFERDFRALVRCGYLCPEDSHPDWLEEPAAPAKAWEPFLAGGRDSARLPLVGNIRQNVRSAALRAYVQGMVDSYTEDLVCNRAEILTRTPWSLPDAPENDGSLRHGMADSLRKAEAAWTEYARQFPEILPYNQYVRYTREMLDEIQWELEESCQQYLVEISEGLKEAAKPVQPGPAEEPAE